MKAEVLTQAPRSIARFIGSRLTGGGFAELAEIATTDHYEPFESIEPFNFGFIADREAVRDEDSIYRYMASRLHRINALHSGELDEWRESYAEEIEDATRAVNNVWVPFGSSRLPLFKQATLDVECIIHPDGKYAQSMAIVAPPRNRR